MNKLALAAAAVLSVATFGAAGAYAQAGGDFAKADANNDSQVTFEEALGANPQLTQDLFNQADADGNGWLDEAEYGNLQGLTAGADSNTTSSSSSEASSVSDASSSSAM